MRPTWSSWSAQFLGCKKNGCTGGSPWGAGVPDASADDNFLYLDQFFLYCGFYAFAVLR